MMKKKSTPIDSIIEMDKQVGTRDSYDMDINIDNSVVKLVVRLSPDKKSLLILDYWIPPFDRGKGIGTKGLEALRGRYDTIYVARVESDFWERMEDRGLIDGIRSEDYEFIEGDSLGS